MFFNFTIRHFLANPRNLAEELQSSSVRGYWQRVVAVFFIGLLLFSVRSYWGVNTENLTSLLTISTADYTLARYGALIGAMIWSVIYIAFHLFGVAYILSFIMGVPFKKLLPMQLLMTVILLLEKLLVLLVFYMTGQATNVSFLSFGPLAVTYLELPFFIFFLNQLTVTTAIIISFQYRFIQLYQGVSKKYRLLFTLIGLHLLMAIFTASISLVPIESLFETIFGGEVDHE